jgi:hypothetical protein
VKGEKEIILVFKVVIDDPWAVFNLGGDLSDAGVFIPFGKEYFPCGIEDQVFNFFSLSFFSFGNTHIEQTFVV